MLKAMRERGIDTSSCLVDPTQDTGFSVVLSRPDDRAILTYPGSIARLRFEQIDLAALEHARHLHVGSFFLLDDLRADLPELFKEAHRLGLTTSLDTNWDPNDRWNSGLTRLLDECDLLFPNEWEARRLAGVDLLEDAVAKLAERVPLLAVKLGVRGGLARAGERQVHAPSLPVEVVDTTGAGDSFNAGFLYGHLHGWDLRRSLALACACGSLASRGSGGTDRQPTLPEVLAALGG